MSRFETMSTRYGRQVEVGRLNAFQPGLAEERVILDVPRQDPDVDPMWVALTPMEARDLAHLLLRHADAAESRCHAPGPKDPDESARATVSK